MTELQGERQGDKESHVGHSLGRTHRWTCQESLNVYVGKPADVADDIASFALDQVQGAQLN